MTADGPLRGFQLTPRAREDLEDIWLYSATTWSPGQADAYIDGVLSTIDTLLAMPKLARERPEFTPPVRIPATGQHLIVYKIESATLLVIRILGSPQNWQAFLKTLDE